MIHHPNIVLVNHRKVDSTFHRSGNSYRNPILNDQIRQCQILRPRYRAQNSFHRNEIEILSNQVLVSKFIFVVITMIKTTNLAQRFHIYY